MARDLEKERLAIGEFGKKTGREPSSKEDWDEVHGFAYGSNLPEELQQLPVNNQTPAQPSVPQATAPAPSGAPAPSYLGQDVSDSALGAARSEYEGYDQGGFIDKVKERLQSKFKPQDERLGLSSYAETLGPLDPSGVMKGMSDKTGQFKRKGQLMLKALGTANSVYSEQAGRAAEKLDNLERGREAYESEQKGLETEMKGLALNMAKQGIDPPPDLLNMLPPQLQQAYSGMAQIIRDSAPGLEQGDFEGNISGLAGSYKAGDLNQTELKALGLNEQQIASVIQTSLTIPDEAADIIKTKRDELGEYFSKTQINQLQLGDMLDASFQEQSNYLKSAGAGEKLTETQEWDQVRGYIDDAEEDVLGQFFNGDLTYQELYNDIDQNSDLGATQIKSLLNEYGIVEQKTNDAGEVTQGSFMDGDIDEDFWKEQDLDWQELQDDARDAGYKFWTKGAKGESIEYLMAEVEKLRKQGKHDEQIIQMWESGEFPPTQ